MTGNRRNTILITGCSSGIGLTSARTCRENGWHVLATCRNEEDCARLRREGFDSFRLDYEDPPSIEDAFATALETGGGRIDAVFNNGAYAIPGMLEDVSVAALRQIFEANLFGWHALTRLVLPVMRRQGSGRIIQNSSVLGFVALRMRGPYVATKFALEGLSDTLRLELKGTGIHVSLIEPGPISTKFGENAVIQFHKWIDIGGSRFRATYERHLRHMASDRPTPGTLPPEAVAAKLLHALDSPRPRPRYYVTRPTYVLGYLRRILSTRVMDSLLYRR